MHYGTAKVGFKLDSVEDFIAGKPNAERSNSSLFKINAAALPAAQKIMVLDPAR